MLQPDVIADRADDRYALPVMLCFYCTQTHTKLTIWIFTWIFLYNFRPFAAHIKCCRVIPPHCLQSLATPLLGDTYCYSCTAS